MAYKSKFLRKRPTCYFSHEYVQSNPNSKIVAKRKSGVSAIYESQNKKKFKVRRGERQVFWMSYESRKRFNQSPNTDRATFGANHRKRISQAVIRPKICAKELNQNRRVSLMFNSMAMQTNSLFFIEFSQEFEDEKWNFCSYLWRRFWRNKIRIAIRIRRFHL